VIQEQEFFRLSRGEIKLLHLDQPGFLLIEGRPLGWDGGLACSQTFGWTQRMEKKEEYGLPWLWKRVPFGTWVKGG